MTQTPFSLFSLLLSHRAHYKFPGQRQKESQVCGLCITDEKERDPCIRVFFGLSFRPSQRFIACVFTITIDCPFFCCSHGKTTFFFVSCLLSTRFHASLCSSGQLYPSNPTHDILPCRSIPPMFSSSVSPTFSTHNTR